MRSVNALLRRRSVVVRILSVLGLVSISRLVRGQHIGRPGAGLDKRWFEAAVAMKQLAESWGDQSYGAVLILDDRLVGEGPSRVVKLGDSPAHAERKAIRDAQRRLPKLARAKALYSLGLIQALQSEGHPIAPGTIGENLTIAGVQ